MRNLRTRHIGRGFEQLEDRRLMAVTAELVDGALVITGDDYANDVAIERRDYHYNTGWGGLGGRVQVNDIEVRANGRSTHFAAGDVRHIQVDLKGGDDVLSYRSGSAHNYPSTTAPYLDKSATLSLGEGNDRCALALGNVYSTVSIDVNAGGGSDTLDTWWSGTVAGDFTVRASLGSGDDSATVEFLDNIHGSPAFERGSATFRLFGESGADDLRLEAFPLAGTDVDPGSVLDVGLFGGSGEDDLAFGYEGVLVGRLHLEMSGGEGRADRMDGFLSLRPGSAGSFQAKVWDYDSGHDAIDFRLYLYSRDVQGKLDLITRLPSRFFSSFSAPQQLATPTVQRPPASDPPTTVSPVDAFFSAGGLVGIGRRASGRLV